MRTFRLLRENEIECRVSEISRDGKWLKLLQGPDVKAYR